MVSISFDFLTLTQMNKPHEKHKTGTSASKLTTEIGTNSKARIDQRTNDFTDTNALSVFTSADFSSQRALHSFNSEYMRRKPPRVPKQSKVVQGRNT